MHSIIIVSPEATIQPPGAECYEVIRTSGHIIEVDLCVMVLLAQCHEPHALPRFQDSLLLRMVRRFQPAFWYRSRLREHLLHLLLVHRLGQGLLLVR